MELKNGTVVILPDYSNQGKQTCGIVTGIDMKSNEAYVKMICANEKSDIWHCVTNISELSPVYQIENYLAD